MILLVCVLVVVVGYVVALLVVWLTDSSEPPLPARVELQLYRIRRSLDVVMVTLEMRVDAARLKRELDAEVRELQRARRAARR